ncbi:SAVED domain-containing protein [Paenibacillus sp. GCM10012306]|uniref:SAVED domain-containing protein n=1 Tax=Paenibacillus sp. GCM10012306 TaxID=3317342 RepID=UPI003606EEA5
MSETAVPPHICKMLWGKAAGRCQYRGCNVQLHIDPTTKKLMNRSYVAHIIADSPNGPRGDEELSPKLAKAMENVMLLCDAHHRLIDVTDVAGHPASLLQEMKKEHEERIELATNVQSERQSLVVLYGSNIGEHSYPISYEQVVPALLPHRYPAESRAVELSWKNSSFYDHEEKFWEMEQENLKRQVKSKLIPDLTSGQYKHASLFALAPQPLLTFLGTMLSDIFPTDVYQLQREPEQKWGWVADETPLEFIVYPPQKIYPTIALALSLSATIDPSRITEILGEETSIWTVTMATPNNDFIKTKEQLMLFRQTLRGLFDQIKLTHGQDNCIHVFPVTAASTAIELGRVWMPKADLPLVLYDQSKKTNKFIKAIEIKKEVELIS